MQSSQRLSRQIQYLFITLLFASAAVVQSLQAGPNADDRITNVAEEFEAIPDLGTDTEQATMGPAAPAANQRVLRRIHHKIAHLRHEMRALNASLITTMSERETSMMNDVELLHASIIAAQLESVDTAAAYREAKSLIADLDNLRQHAIADLALPSDYTPPEVTAPSLASVPMNPQSVLASIHEHTAKYERSLASLEAEFLDFAPGEINRSLLFADAGTGPPAAWDGLAAELGVAAESFSSIISGLRGGAWYGAIDGMSRNMR